MRTIKLILEYEGTKYHGWQRQKNALSVQEVFEGALERITGSKTPVTASGRTDAGVHAKAQVVSFSTSSEIKEWKLQNGLNALLPPDIAVLLAEEVEPGFHARYSSKGKVYLYTVLNRTCRSAFKRGTTWFVAKHLDVEQMKIGARALLGKNDFTSFRSSSCCAPNPTRVLDEIKILKKGDEIIFSFKGNGFLKQMVRNIVGTLVDVGLGKTRAEEIEIILKKKDRRFAGPTAPPQGLCLKSVLY